MVNELATLTKQENGDLEVTITLEGYILARELQNEGMQSDDAILGDLLEYDLCNGWGLLYADEIGCLSNAPVLTDAWYDDWRESGQVEVTDGHWWYFEPYQVRSVVTDLLRDGKAIFTKGSKR